MKLVNQLRLLRKEVSEKRIVNKILVSLSKRFEAKISFLKDSKELTRIFVNVMISALLAQEQRKALKCEDLIENALVAKTKCLRVKGEGSKKLVGKGNRFDDGKQKDKYLSCPHCKKKNRTPNDCWNSPNVKCRACS